MSEKSSKQENRPSEEQVTKLLKKLPQRLPYYHWLICLSAIGNSFDAEAAERILLSHFRDETPGEHRRKLRNRLTTIGIGSLVWLVAKYVGQQKGRELSITMRDVSGNHPCHREPPSYPPPDETQRLYLLNGQILYCMPENRALLRESLRVFRIAVNREVTNKTTNYRALTNGFRNEWLNAEGIAEVVRNGYALVPSHMITEPDTDTIRRSTESWQCSELVMLDFDSGVSITKVLEGNLAKKLVLVYTTCSHTEENPRFRAVIALPGLVRNRIHYTNIIKEYIVTYSSDSACSDVCRAFFGNTNATITFGSSYYV